MYYRAKLQHVCGVLCMLEHISCMGFLVVDTAVMESCLHAFCPMERQEMLMKRQSTELLFTGREKKHNTFYHHAHLPPL